MASIDWRSSRAYIRFYDSNREPKEKKVSLSLDDWTKEEVRRYKRELVVLYEKGEWDPWAESRPKKGKEIPTLKEAMKAYVDEKTRAGKRGEAGGWTESTRRGKESVLWDWISEIGPGRQVTSLHFEDARDYVHRGDIALATRKGYRKALNAFLSWVEEQGYQMPARVPPLKEEVPPPPFITEEELYAICEAHCEEMAAVAERKHVAWETPHQRAWMTEAWRFLFYQGLRRSELFRMKRRDIDAENWQLRIGHHQKNASESVIPIPPPARDVIRPFLEIESGEQPFTLGDESRLTKAFKRAVDRCKAITDPERVQKLNVKSLRHSCAMYWKRQGASPYDLRDLLRHGSITVTEKYERMDPVGMSERFEKLSTLSE